MGFQLPKRAGLRLPLPFLPPVGAAAACVPFLDWISWCLRITMRPATAVFWSPRYSDGFKHVTAMFVLLAVPMRYQRAMQFASI